MKKGFAARRVPRRIGADEEDSPSAGGDSKGGVTGGPTIIRPSSKARKASSLRTAFQPGASDDEDAASTGVVVPKRSQLSRIAIQRNASQQSSALAGDLLHPDGEADEDGPSYSAAALNRLKDSTPTTPNDLTTGSTSSDVDDVASDTQALDISSKFGTQLSRYQQPSAIPSATEIAAKKARRARLAQEQAAEEYISLDPDDPGLDDDDDDNVTRDEYGRLILKPEDKYKEAESRLVHDDEDIMENFDDFTEADGKIVMGRKAEAEAARKRKADMAAQIAAAERESDSDSDASERERNEAFEAAQTKHGTYGSHTTAKDPYADMRPKTPSKISPLPRLDGVIERLRRQVAELQTSRMQKLQEMEALQREKIRLGEEEIRIQRSLKETAEKFQQMRTEKGIEVSPPVEDEIATNARSAAATLLEAPISAIDSGANSEMEGMDGGHLGLGFGGVGRGLESLDASAVATPENEIDSDDGDTRMIAS